MMAFSSILDSLRCHPHPPNHNRSSFRSVRSLKRSTFHSFSSSRSSSSPPPPVVASSPLPGRPLDVVIHNLHTDAWGTARAARPIPVETLLAHVHAVIARRHIRLHSVAATAFSITLVIDDSLDMMVDSATQAGSQSSAPSEKSGCTASSRPTDKLNHRFRSLVAELLNAVEGVDLSETDFICEENRRSRILGQRRKHEW